MAFAPFLRDRRNYQGSAHLFKRLINGLEKIERPNQSTMNDLALAHNELAFHTYVPELNWKAAEYQYQRSVDYFAKAGNRIETANVSLNLQTMYHLSGQKVDLGRVKELTKILEEAGDNRAEKGHKLLKELSK